jgi:GxxExxY protein
MNQEQEMNNLTHKVIGCAMSVYKALGNGFNEEIYQKALSVEFEMNGIEYIQDHKMDIIYKENKIGTRIVDFFIEGCLMLEIKLLTEILEEHRIQGINLLEAYRIADGLLINFGGSSLEFKRVYNNKLKRG